ncbi:uncharacterized protein [Porites lutea]|uniref:uncharacterized protein n=1 Tax=Porites lutea TaxID=51062 RepID=UPI003CC53B59
MDTGKRHSDSDPKAYSADREEEPVHPGLQSDTAEDEESENYPQEMFPLEEASHCTENGKPIRTCTEETLEPRLVVYGTRSAWSRGSGNKPSQAQRQDDDPNAYSTDREEEPVHPGLQSDDTAEEEESENYPQEPFPFDETSQLTENEKPLHQCTEETLEPRLVVYGARSAWSRGSGSKPSQAERQVDDGTFRQADSLFVLTFLLFIFLWN